MANVNKNSFVKHQWANLFITTYKKTAAATRSMGFFPSSVLIVIEKFYPTMHQLSVIESLIFVNMVPCFIVKICSLADYYCNLLQYIEVCFFLFTLYFIWYSNALLNDYCIHSNTQIIRFLRVFSKKNSDSNFAHVYRCIVG